MKRLPPSSRLTTIAYRRGRHRALAGILLAAALALPLAQAGCSPVQSLPWPPPAESMPIQAGDVHSWTFDMGAGEFLGVVAEQQGADVIVEVFDEENRLVFDADSADDGWWMTWQEEVAWIAPKPGRYHLVVRPWNVGAKGRFLLRVEGPRPARVGDASRAEAAAEIRAATAELGQPGHEAARLEHLHKALALWTALGEPRRQAEVLHQIGVTAGGIRREEDAAAAFHRALEIWEKLGLEDRKAWTLLRAGRSDLVLLRKDEARAHVEEALRIARSQKNREFLLQAQYFMGRNFHAEEPRLARDYMGSALALARELGDRRMELLATYRLGWIYDDLAERQDALRLYEKALSMARQDKELRIEADALNALGLIYKDLGQNDRAIQYYEQAMAIARARGDSRQETALLNNLALIYEQQDPDRSRSLYEKTLALGLENRDQEAQTAALSNRAYLELRVGNNSKALELADQALALGVKTFEISILQARGMAWRKLGDLEASGRDLRKALELSRGRQERVRESLVLFQLARTVRQAGGLRDAREMLESSLQIIESQRTKVADESLRATFLADRQYVYGLYIDTLMDLHRAAPGLGHDAEALRASERARARSLLDILAESETDIHEGADPALLDRQQRLRAEIESLEKRRLDPAIVGSGAGPQETNERLGTLFEEYGRVEADLRASSPRYAALTQPQPIGPADIQSGILDGRGLLLEYYLGEDRSFLWAVSPNGLASFELPPRARIEDAARRYYAALVLAPDSTAGKEAETGLRQAADELSEMLLKPIEGLLAGQPLLIVSDGALQYVPFAALPAPSSLGKPKRTPVVAGNEVVSLPSASALTVLRRELAGRPDPPKTLAVLADPVFQSQDPRVVRPGSPLRTARAKPPSSQRGASEPSRGEVDPRNLPRLRFSEREADAIAALVPEGQRLKALGFRATRAMATGGELAAYQMVHFATHGLIDSRRPELSSLVLSLVDEKGRPQNGFLRLHDIYNLELRSDLVVLSACQTALGQEIRGEGLLGLTRGFMYAGSARVLSSLWSVDDRATSELMQRFYRHMITGGLSPASALRKAQVEMQNDERWKAPYHWAGFSLQGEWR